MNDFNIFITFTEPQLIHVGNILAVVKLNNVLIISRIRPKNIQKYIAQNVDIVYIDESIVKLHPKWNQLKKSLINREEGVNLHLPHSLNIFSQDMQHFLIKKNKLLSLNVFPDGNLLFNTYRVKKWAYENISRKIKSLLLGLNYKLFEGNIISPFYAIDKVYSYLEDVSCECGEIIIISMQSISFQNKNIDGIVVLGHRNQKVISADKLSNIISQRFSNIKIFYKKHPRIKLKDDQFYKKLNSNNLIEVSLIEENEPIEVILRNKPVNKVFAVASSSLLTLKLANPELEIFYCGMKEYLGNHYNERLKHHFDVLKLTEIEY